LRTRQYHKSAQGDEGDTMHAVLLDMDGTLIRSEHVHRAIWQRFFTAWQVEMDDERYADAVMGRRARDVLAHLPGPWTPDDLPGALASLDADVDAAAREVTVVDGAVALIRELAARGHRLAVVTSGGRSWAERVLDDVLDVRDALEVVVTAEEVEVGKPSPEGYLTACRRLGVAPAGCAAVEDAPSGVRALVAAGVGRIVGVSTTSSAMALRAAGAMEVVPDLRPALALPALGLS
jgi:mannitol-1-/sugar-/sorbitol-6-phosphatase